MSLSRWLGETPLSDFIERSYLRLPFSSVGGGADDCALGSWVTLGAILGQENVDAMMVRDGRRVEMPLPRNLLQAEAALEAGCTILVRNAERHDPALADLARGFAHDFCGQVNVHVYATPAERFGFGWHYDAEEVFILQTVGAKEYSLRKNTVNPWPLEETLPTDMHYEREIMPLMRCLLSPGDWLYIPCGYWHKAEARETSISLAVGVMAPAALDLFDFVRRQLLDTLRWRQRLPVAEMKSAAGGKVPSALRDLARDLAADLGKTLSNENTLEAYLAELRVRHFDE